MVRRCRTQSLDATFFVSVVALLSSPKRINTHRKFPPKSEFDLESRYRLENRWYETVFSFCIHLGAPKASE